MKNARCFSILLAAAVAALIPVTALAVTASPSPKRTFDHPPVNVSNCNPKQNSYMATGFTPAYYPVGAPYWGWPSVYGAGFNYYSYPVQGNASLAIDYHNTTSIVMDKIEFGLLLNGNLVAEVLDVGTFSPEAEIKHEFGVSNAIFPLTGIPRCVALKILFKDGTHWTNPHLPALRGTLYNHHP